MKYAQPSSQAILKGEYSSAHLNESSSDEGGLRLESEEIWEMISIWGMHYTVFPK